MGRPNGKPEFDITQRGFRIRAWYDGSPNVRIERESGELVREFDYEDYRIWNLAAHFDNIVDGLIEADNCDSVGREAD